MSTFQSFTLVHSFLIFIFFHSTDNFKAVYQRAKAHAALLNEGEAQRDFAAAEKLNPKFKPFVRQELKKLAENIRAMHARQNKTYWDTTKDKWGPGGGETKSAARKKSVKCAQKATDEKTTADQKTEATEVQEKKRSEEHRLTETEGDDAVTEKNPNEKKEQSNKEPECRRTSEEGLDKGSTETNVAPEAGLGAPDNHAADKDSDPPATGSGKDNVVSRRSSRDKGRKKVKCQSSDAPNPRRTRANKKASSGEGGPIRADQHGNVCGSKSHN